jgi:hypothetical protein
VRHSIGGQTLMTRNKDKGRIEGPFVPMLIQTTGCPAWRALSAHAREVYRVLKSRYGFDARNNGRIYLSARQAAKETGFNRNIIARCLRELAYYGFIVMTEPGCLGVNGRGKAPHWRLTELGYMRELPTREFLKWDGELFHEQKSPAYYKRQAQRLIKLRATQKQKPVTTIEPGWHDHRDIPVARPSSHSDAEVARPSGHTTGQPCHDHQDISRANHSVVLDPLPDPLVVSAQRQRLDALGARLVGVGVRLGIEKNFGQKTLGTSTLGTLDAGLIATNPGVA